MGVFSFVGEYFLFVYLGRVFGFEGKGFFCCFVFTQIQGHISDYHNVSYHITLMNI